MNSIFGAPRMRGARAAYYRRLIMPLLNRRSVGEMSLRMAELAENQVSSWPRGVATDLLPLAELLMQDLSVNLLFGNERDDALPVAALISRQLAVGWPLPWLGAGAKRERAILTWAEKARDTPELQELTFGHCQQSGRKRCTAQPPNHQWVFELHIWRYFCDDP